MNRLLNRLPELMFWLALLVVGVIYGIAARTLDWFPNPQIRDALFAVAQVTDHEQLIELPAPLPGAVKVQTFIADRLSPGLVFMTGVDPDLEDFARVIDRQGNIIFQWRPNWFDIWGDEGFVADYPRPETLPGAIIHGAKILSSGDLVFNFDRFSTVRLDPCGKVVWKLQNLGHHSIDVDDDGMIWAGSRKVSTDGAGYPNTQSPTPSYLIEKISPDGRILEDIPIFDVLRDNGLDGLFYMASLVDRQPVAEGDTMHLNDIEVFSAHMPSGIFAPGDILFSLRNINSVFVMDPVTHKIKFASTGQVLRQHDPDFVDGNTISVFDNHNLLPHPEPDTLGSRIVEIDARTHASKIVIDGRGQTPFFSATMGTHQRLENGNILVNPAEEGRLLEFLPDGRLAWSYDNRFSHDTNGLLTGGEILPPEMDTAFFKTLAASCP